MCLCAFESHSNTNAGKPVVIVTSGLKTVLLMREEQRQGFLAYKLVQNFQLVSISMRTYNYDTIYNIKFLYMHKQALSCAWKA